MAQRSYRWSELPHLAKRTVWSLRKPVPDPAGEAWLLARLSPAEADLYRAMSAPDRAHAIGCGLAVAEHGDEVVVASAMHDVGKVAAGLSTGGRVLATLVGLGVPDAVSAWRDRPGLSGRIACYLDHAELGASMLTEAGSSALAVAWAREHHRDPAESSIDPELFAAMHDADETADDLETRPSPGHRVVGPPSR